MSEQDSRDKRFPGSPLPSRFPGAPGSLPLARPAATEAPVPGLAFDEDVLAVLDPQDAPTGYGFAPPVAPTPSAPPVAPVAFAPTPHVGMPVAPVAAPRNAPVAAPAASTPGVREADRMVETPVSMDDLLLYLAEVEGSDLYLTVGSPPVVRVNGDLIAIPGYAPLTPGIAQDCIYGILQAEQRAKFEQKKELNLAHTIPGVARFRVNVLRQRGSVGSVIRLISSEIRSLEELGMPEIIGTFAGLERGLVLVTGQTGSGKSTSLAAIIDRANRTRSAKILTIEDPIEYLHQHRGCVIDQREVGEDTHSFQDALENALRQHPDIILIGELRTQAEIAVALTAAETGHLVFATLHTRSAVETVTRIVDVFPPEQQQQVRVQLAGTLQAVVCQTLVKKAEGKGQVAAVEVMVQDTGISNYIRTDQLQSIPSELQSGSKKGMQTLNQHLARMVLDGVITYEEGLRKCQNPSDFDDLTGGREGVLAAAKARAQREQRARNGFGGGFTGAGL